MTENKMRLDKWLKIARFFKQRTRAHEAILSGEVKVNEEKVKPARMVGAGDKLTIKLDHFYRKFEIKAISHKSISRADARELYRMEDSPLNEGPMADYLDIWREQEKENRKEWREWGGKISKKARRELNKQKYQDV